VSAECYFSALERANAESVAAYLAQLATELQTQGYEQVTLYLDPDTTHLQKMQISYRQQTAHLAIQMRFVHFAAYSPALNLAEYAIHWLRQHSLHHACCSQRLAQVKERLAAVIKGGIFTAEQIVNILVHIEQLVSDKQKQNLSP